MTWRLGLNRVRHVFSVRSVTSAWTPLTVRLQTELETNTRTIVSGAHQGSVKKSTIAADVHRDIWDAESMVSRVRNDSMSNVYREGGDGKNQTVSATRTPVAIA